MATFMVRETQEQLEKLDKAIRALGYKDRADWYRQKKRETIKEATMEAKNREAE